MQKSTFILALVTLLLISACSSSGGATSVPPTTPTLHCKDKVCIQRVIVFAEDTGDLTGVFVLTDQDGKVNAAYPPRFTQDFLSVQGYRIGPDQTEKLAFGQNQASEEFVCGVGDKAAWTHGQLSAACIFSVAQGSTLVKVQAGDHLKVKLSEFDFEQVVEVTNQPKPATKDAKPGAVDRTGGTRILLAAADCPGPTPTYRDMANRLTQTGKIILYRLISAQGGLTGIQIEPSIQIIGDCQIQVELPPLGDPAPYIKLVQQPGRFELIDAGSDHHFPGTVLRTTGSPSPTVPISIALQSTIPARQYEVIATNADLDLDHLMTVGSGNNYSPQLEIGLQDAAAQKLAKVTTAHSISMNNKDPYYLCILLDNVVEFCPSISTPLINGRAVFSFDDNFEADRLASILRHGILPVELHVVKTETIYSQLTN